MATVIAVPYYSRMVMLPPRGVDAEGLVELLMVAQGPLAARPGRSDSETWSYPDVRDLQASASGDVLMPWSLGESATTIQGATGAEPATGEERNFLHAHQAVPVRATRSRFGHTMEAQFPLGIALAALSLSRGALFPPGDSSGAEIAMTAAPTQIVVSGAGHWRGEGMALLEAVS